MAKSTNMQSGSGSWGYMTSGLNWTLETGTGERSCAVTIPFADDFNGSPNVIFAVNGLDVSNAQNTRVQANVSSVTATGFTVTFVTWGSSLVYTVYGCWLAYQP